MTKYFMRETPLAELEREMMSIPNFVPRRGSTTVSIRGRVKCVEIECEAHILYNDSTQKDLPSSCDVPTPCCPLLTYKEVVRLCFDGVNHFSFQVRVNKVTELVPKFSFHNISHAQRMQQYIVCRKDGSLKERLNLAVLYLLTSQKALWMQTGSAIKNGCDDISQIALVGVDYQGYVIFQVACSIQRGVVQISPEELANEELVTDDTLRLIVNAILIARYGTGVLNCKSSTVRRRYGEKHSPRGR